jgi:hypothetical protein
MAQNWWEAYPSADLNGRPKPLLTEPDDPYRAVQMNNARANTDRTNQQIANNPLDRASTQTNIDRGQQGLNLDRAGAIDKVRDGYRKDDRVTRFEQALPVAMSGLHTPENAAGDNLLVNAIAKVSDPTTGVQAREGESWANAQPGTEKLKADLLRQFGSDGYGNFTPEGRTKIREALRGRLKDLATQYGQAREDHRKYIESLGLPAADVEAILGPDAYKPYQGEEEQYIRAHGGTPKINGVPIDGSVPPPRTTTKSGFDLEQPATIPGAEDFRAGLYSAMRDKGVKSYEDVVRYTDQFNQQHGTHFPPPTKDKGLFNAIAASLKGKKFDIALPQYDARTLQKVKEMERNAGRDTAVKAGVKDAITVGGADELQGAVNALGQSLRGGGSFSDLYGVNRDAARIYRDFQQQTHPFYYAGGQLAGSAALPGFGARSPLELARLGAAYGGAYGFNSGQGGIGNRLGNAVEGAAAGGATGYAVPEFLGAGNFGRSLAERNAALRPPHAMDAEAEGAMMRQSQIDTARGAQDLGIQMPRFVAGGPTAQRFGAMADQSQFGTPAIRRGAKAMLDQSEAARDKIARSVGNILDPESMGDAAITGAKAINAANKGDAGRLYTKADELNGGTRYPLPRAAAELDRQIAELSDTPGGAAPAILKTFEDVRAKLDGEWSPEGINRMRTSLSNRFVESGMSPGDASRRARSVVDAAQADIMQGMRAAGKDGAASVLRQASQKWAENEQLKERVIQPILGINREKTGAEVARGLTTAFKNNPNRAKQFMAAMPDDQARDIRASVIAQMGNPGSGAQDVEGKAFSLATFLTHWNDIKHVRNGLFDPQTIGALNKLANIAERAKTAGHVENHSNTGGIGIALMTGGPALSAPALLATGHVKEAALAVVTSIGLALAQHGGATLLASPNFARKLAQTPMETKAAQQFWSGRWVQKLAATNPEIREPLMRFQQRLLANDNFAPSLSANPNEEQNQQQPY